MIKLLAYIGSRPVVACSLLCLIVLLLYINSLWFKFVWDDQAFVVQNDSIRSLRNIGLFFTDPTTFTFASPGTTALYAWRPIRNISYAIDYQWTKLNPAGWHLHNLALHALAACTVFFFARTLIRVVFIKKVLIPPAASIIPVLSALLWACHPALAEVAAYVKGRDDELATIFILVSSLMFIKAFAGLKVRWMPYAWALVAFWLSALSKESTFTIPLFAVLFVWFQIPSVKTRHRVAFATASIAFLLNAVLFVFFRHLVLGQSGQWGYLVGTLGKMMVAMIPAFTRYVYIGLWPFPPNYLIVDYDMFPMVSKLLYPPVLICLFLLIVVAYNWLIIAARNRLVAWGGLLFLLALAPVSNVIPTVQLMAERFLYLPQVGIALALAGLLAGVRQKWALRAGTALLLLYATLLAFSTYQRSWVFQDDRSLHESAFYSNPWSDRAAFNYGMALTRSDPTTNTLNKAWGIAGRIRQNHYNRFLLRSKVQSVRGNHDEARRLLARAEEVQPGTSAVKYLASEYELDAGNYALAARLFQELIDTGAPTPQTFYNLAVAKMELGDKAGALSALDQCESLNPILPEIPILREKIMRRLGNRPNPVNNG